MKTILFHANRDDGFESRLPAALDVVSAFGGHLLCLQATPYDSFILSDPFGGVYALPEVIDQVRRAEEAHRAQVEERLSREGISWTWLPYNGQAAQLLVDRSRLTDLTILSLGARDGRIENAPVSLAGEVLVHTPGPLLAVPQGVNRIDCQGRALIAWNGSPESSRALRASLPLLKKASAVHVVTVCEDETDFPATEACEYLSRHSVATELHEWPRGGRPIADVLADAASVLKAAYIVAGAYGHSRFREAVLGGATRDLLERSTLPLLLAH